jgi:cytochrome c oxidase cbb3-type subunit IV
MLSEHFSTVQGVTDFALASMILAVIFFAVTFVWAMKLDKKYLNHMGNLPLDINLENKNNSEKKDEVNK